METVLRVRVPGISMPWKELMRGCLVILLFGILYFGVQNCAQRNEGITTMPAGSAIREGASAAALETELPVIVGMCRPAVTDMERGLTAFEPELRAAVKSAPVQNIPAVSYTLPELELETAVPYTVTDNEAEEPKWTESVIADKLPVMDVTDVPKENIVTENPSIPNITDAPKEDAAPESPAVPEEPAISQEPVLPEEIDGFLLDSEGYITGCTDRVVLRDDLLIIPESDRIVGIRSGAFDGLGESIMDVYLPANISDIEPGVFDVFPYLMFIEVSGDNPYYYSLNGILYSASGEEIFCPAGRITE